MHGSVSKPCVLKGCAASQCLHPPLQEPRMRSSCPAGSRRVATPSLHPIALAVAVFTFSPAWAQTGTAAQQPAEQTPASAPDELVQEPKALGSITISGARESASTRLPLTPRETPQSTSTVTRAQIERQSLTSIDAVLRCCAM